MITNWGGGHYQLRCAHAAKHVLVAVITNWGLLHSPPPTALRNVQFKRTYGLRYQAYRDVTISQGEFTEGGGGSWVRGIVRILQFDKFWGKNKKFRKIQNARYRKLSFNLNFRITSQTSLAISLNTGLSTKDETSKTTVRNSCCMYVPTVSNNYKILHFFAKSLVI